MAWVKANIARYGGDPGNVFLIGHSAGAYLAALLLLDPRYLAAHQLAPRDLRGAVLVSGFFYVDGPGVAPDRPKDTWGTDINVWKAASPATYVRRDVPPLLLLYADGDAPWRIEQQSAFAKALHAAGDNDVEMRLLTGRDHYTIWNKMAEGEEETSRAALQFMERVRRPSRGASAGPTSPPDNDAAAIRATREAQNAAIVAHDLDRIASAWTDDVTITRGLGAVLQGRAAYRKLWEGDSVTYQRTPERVEVSKAWPLAFESGTWTGRLAPLGSAPVISGRYSAQWVKRDGRWLIHSEVFVALACSGAACRWPLTLP